MLLLEILIVRCNMLDKLVDLCKNDLVNNSIESESPKIMIPGCPLSQYYINSSGSGENLIR